MACPTPRPARGVLELDGRRRSRRRIVLEVTVGVVVASLAMLTGWAAIRPALTTLGSTAAERAATMPRDTW